MSTQSPKHSTPAPPVRHRWLIALTLALSLASLWLSELALFAGFLAFLAWLSLPPLSARTRRRWLFVLALGGLLSLVGLTRFVGRYALAGMLTASKRNQDKGSVSRLREILFAQDQARQKGLVDPDGDHVGSALFMGELAGVTPPRGLTRREPLLDRRYQNLRQTPLGAASSVGGYLYMVCVPAAEGLVARSGAGLDEELAERHFVAYAWPERDESSYGKLFFIDQHERILEFSNRTPSGKLLYVGANAPPPCDAAEQRATEFLPWQGKKPRDFLPGLPGNARP